MDIGAYSQLFPELITERSLASWSRELLEYFNIKTNKWQPMAQGAQAVLAAEEKWNDETLTGLIRSIEIRELDCALVAVQEAGLLLIGLVRGKDVRISGAEEIEFSAFADLSSTVTPDAGTIWNPDEGDMFDVSDDLENLISE